MSTRHSQEIERAKIEEEMTWEMTMTTCRKIAKKKISNEGGKKSQNHQQQHQQQSLFTATWLASQVLLKFFLSLFLSFWLSLSHSHSLFVISPSYIQSREKDCTVCGSELAIYSTQIARAHLWAFYASVFIVYCDCFKNWKETKLRTKWMKN